jgi:hypothetical protein
MDSRDGNATRKGAGINKSNATQEQTAENSVQGAGMEENRIGQQEADMEMRAGQLMTQRPVMWDGWGWLALTACRFCQADAFPLWLRLAHRPNMALPTLQMGMRPWLSLCDEDSTGPFFTIFTVHHPPPPL